MQKLSLVLVAAAVALASVLALAAPASATHDTPNVADQYGNPASLPVKPGTLVRNTITRGALRQFDRGDVMRIFNITRVRRGAIIVVQDCHGTIGTIIAGQNAFVRLANGRLIIRLFRPVLWLRGGTGRDYIDPRCMRVLRTGGVFR